VRSYKMETFFDMRAYCSPMLRILVLLSLVFSTVGITVVNCACPKVEMKQTACSHCPRDNTPKTKSCCPDCSKRVVLKTDFQKPNPGYQPILQTATSFYQVATNLNLPFYFPSPLRRDDSNTISPPSSEKCALLSTFLI